MNAYKEHQCHCTDRSLVNMVIQQNSNGKYELFTVSEVYGMGAADYNKKVLPDIFDDIIPFNTVRGISHIALLKDNSWRLIELTDNDTIEGKWRWLDKSSFSSLDDVKDYIKNQKLDNSSES